MDGEEIVNKNFKLLSELKEQNQFPVIDLEQNLVVTQWIESFLKELDQDLEKSGNKL